MMGHILTFKQTLFFKNKKLPYRIIVYTGGGETVSGTAAQPYQPISSAANSYCQFIPLADGSFVSFSVNGGQAEIKPPLDTLNLNVPVNLNVNIPVKVWFQSAAAFVLTTVSLTVIPPGALAKTKDSIIVQKPSIAVISDMGWTSKPQNSAPIFNCSQNVSISDVAAVEKVDLNSTSSIAEETSLEVVNQKSKKSNTIKKKNKDSLIKSTGKNQEKSNSLKSFLKNVKIIAVGSIEVTNLISEQLTANPAVNQPAGQQLTQASPNLHPDELQPNQQRLAEEIFILTDVNEEYSKELLYQSREGANRIIRDLNVLDGISRQEGLACREQAGPVVQQTTQDLQNIQKGPENLRLKNTRNKAIKLAQTVHEAWDTGERICNTATKNIGLILEEAQPLPALLERTYNVISPLRELVNSRLIHGLNPSITHKHQHFGEAVRSVVMPDLVDNRNPLDRLQVIYSFFEPEAFLPSPYQTFPYHNGILPQKIVVGVIAGQNDNQAAELAKRISGFDGDLVHACIQRSLVSNSIKEVVPGAEPQSIALRLPANPLQNFHKAKKFPVKVWSDTSHTCVPAEYLANIKPVAAVILDSPHIQHPASPDIQDPALVSGPDNVVVVNDNVNNLVLKGNLLVAARLKVDTKTPHLSGVVQADLFNLNYSNASLKDRLFFGASVDLLGAIGAKNNQPWLIEVSAQKSVLSSAYRISLNVGCELGF